MILIIDFITISNDVSNEDLPELTEKYKEKIKNDLISIFCSEQEIETIILFGSFIHSDNPNDLDIAIIEQIEKGVVI